MASKWKLNIGCHRGTLTSRDSESREFDTEAEALESYRKICNFYRSIGYQVWFAEVVSPDDNKTLLEQNPYF